mmetsp:Transcript_27565/g.65333  ORF Transcript_27565/g.65333 Transcript_27565/m.65333 type:complete len:295 (+) Transcript_27565:386-1270(+)
MAGIWRRRVQTTIRRQRALILRKSRKERSKLPVTRSETGMNMEKERRMTENHQARILGGVDLRSTRAVQVVQGRLEQIRGLTRTTGARFDTECLSQGFPAEENGWIAGYCISTSAALASFWTCSSRVARRWRTSRSRRRRCSRTCSSSSRCASTTAGSASLSRTRAPSRAPSLSFRAQEATGLLTALALPSARMRPVATRRTSAPAPHRTLAASASSGAILQATSAMVLRGEETATSVKGRHVAVRGRATGQDTARDSATRGARRTAASGRRTAGPRRPSLGRTEASTATFRGT